MHPLRPPQLPPAPPPVADRSSPASRPSDLATTAIHSARPGRPKLANRSTSSVATLASGSSRPCTAPSSTLYVDVDSLDTAVAAPFSVELSTWILCCEAASSRLTRDRNSRMKGRALVLLLGKGAHVDLQLLKCTSTFDVRFCS